MFTRSDHFGVFNTNEMQKGAWCVNLPGDKQKLCGKTFAQEVSPFFTLRLSRRACHVPIL